MCTPKCCMQDCDRMVSDFNSGNFPKDMPAPKFDTGKGFVVPKASPVLAEMSLSIPNLDRSMESSIDLRLSHLATTHASLKA